MGSEIIAKFRCHTAKKKLLVRNKLPVPQTDTGSRGEYPQVSERTLVKELGKMTPVTSEEGVLTARSAAVNRPKQLFIKTQVSAKS